MEKTTLPEEYLILPESIDFIIPGFTKFYMPGDRTFALRQRDPEEWFHEFVDRIVTACGRQFLPVCRMSDGEFLFALGRQPPSKRVAWRRRMHLQLIYFFRKHIERTDFQAKTAPGVSSGRYSNNEWHATRQLYAQMIHQISLEGVLALHLSYAQKPFQEKYFPAFRSWLKAYDIHLTDKNYYPFYFVYAMLTGPRREDLLKDRCVLLVHGAEGEKRCKIEETLRREGVTDIFWCQISSNRSLYDRINIAPFIGKIDIAFVGAGIGKPNILLQMAPLNVPCIDAGYVFETWAEKENKYKRVWCAPDEEWDNIQRDPISLLR